MFASPNVCVSGRGTGEGGKSFFRPSPVSGLRFRDESVDVRI